MAKKNQEAEVMQTNFIPAPEGFEIEETGFPPYWNPTPGASFYGTVESIDDNDPEFVRIQIRALAPLLCARGAGEEAHPVQVNAGELFTVSQYAALNLEDYLGYEVWVKAVEKVKGGVEKTRGGMVWVWELRCSKDTSEAVKNRKLNAAKNSAQQLTA